MSQLDTDGLLVALLKEAGTNSKSFVDIGCGRSGGNSGLLAGELGWKGLMVDASKTAVRRVAERFSHNPNVQAVCTFVTPQNINQMLTDAGYVGEVDIFSLDIDSYDYWVFQSMTVCNPRILLLEYNAAFGPDKCVTVPIDAQLDNTPKGYHGASLRALVKLAESKGYRLVSCDQGGANALFLRSDVATHVPGVDVSMAFRMSVCRKDPFGQTVRDPDIYDVIKKASLDLNYV